MVSFLDKLKTWFKKPVKKSQIKPKEIKKSEPVNIDSEKYRKLDNNYERQQKLINQLERKIKQREAEKRENDKEISQIIVIQAQIKQIETKTSFNGKKIYQSLILSDGENTWNVVNFAKYNVNFKEILNQDYWFSIRGSVLVDFSYRKEELIRK